jgi:branched-chain amino acid transport system substrate-binding protein
LRSRAKVVAGCLVGTMAFAVSACGSDSNSGSSSSSGSTSTAAKAAGGVDVYSSLPLQGASKDQTNAMVDGIKLALKEVGNKAGTVSINYTSLDDSTAQAGNWDEQQVGANARKVAQDKKSVALIGEFNSGATKVSLPILNEVGIAQISPANTYVGLTTNDPGSAKGEPAIYYPSQKRTYARIVPRDTIQGGALVTQMKADGCKAVALANDKDTYGAGLTKVIGIKAKTQGLNILGDTGIQPDAANFRGYASQQKGLKADCFFFGGVTANGAIQLYKDVHDALPNAKLYGGDGVCESGFTSPKKNGIPTGVGKLFKCTVATLDLASYPGGKAFIASFNKEYHNPKPDPYAIYGYEAMKLVLDTIKSSPSASTRDGFVKALFATKDRASVLGKYSIDANGDTTLTDYGLYTVGSDGNPTYASTIKAAG